MKQLGLAMEALMEEEIKTTYRDYTFTLPTNVSLGVDFLLERAGLDTDEFFVKLCNKMYERRRISGSLDFVSNEEKLTEDEDATFNIISAFSDAVTFEYNKAAGALSPKKS
jgi:hypothetical protein